MTGTRRWLGLLLLLLIASIGLKLASFGSEPSADSARLVRDITGVLIRNGLVAKSGTGKAWQREIVAAQHGSCTFRVQNSTILGADFAASQRNNLNAGRPIRYIRGGKYLDTYPGLVIEMTWRMQREAARVGWRYPISPVLAVGASDACWPDPALFDGTMLYMR